MKPTSASFAELHAQASLKRPRERCGASVAILPPARAAHSVVTPFGSLYNTCRSGLQASCRPEIGELMLNDVYNKRILELAANIPRQGRLAHPDASATAHSRLCGSTVTVDLVLRDGKVADFAHEVKACALGQASSSIMARTIIGATPDELRQVRADVRRMLKENGPPPGAAGPISPCSNRCGTTKPVTLRRCSPSMPSSTRSIKSRRGRMPQLRLRPGRAT